ncbi:hypothetical protein PVK06_035346 [Gossypium arboreum]|uniref:Uncharacterized protein n=1 Tax=Gossypium arboreum TaxID=29729 RepID=A0ABR0NGK3_GOSAR|nr:hypothetical protein PVK06_035346 [Gossypium arboreum]
MFSYEIMVLGGVMRMDIVLDNRCRENSLFEEPGEQGQNREEVPMVQRTLREYALPTPDVMRGSVEQWTNNANNFEHSGDSKYIAIQKEHD